MDSEYNVKVSYIDIIDSQGIDEDGIPFFSDIYLDLVVYPDGTVIVDDMDELEQAWAKNEISLEQYNRTLAVADKLKNGLLCDMQKYNEYVQDRLHDVFHCLQEKKAAQGLHINLKYYSANGTSGCWSRGAIFLI